MKTLQIKQLSPNAKLPTRAHSTDAGLDIYAAETIVLRPQGQHILKTGIAVNIPAGYVGFLTSRSGVSSRTKLVIETGKIDAGYNGELGINIKNDDAFLDTESQLNNRELSKGFAPLMYDVKGEKIENGNPFQHDIGKVYKIEQGDKIAQLVIVPIVTPQLEIVDQFDTQSERGDKGFGSSDLDCSGIEVGKIDTNQMTEEQIKQLGENIKMFSTSDEVRP